jgi:uncharacterized integral membrane protein (TIGR00697 family)
VPRAAAGTFPILVALFCALLVISNVAAVKLFGPGTVTIGGHHWDVTFDGGAFLFPLTYIIGDVLAEVFGFKAARRAIITGFACSALASGVFWLVQVVPPAANWEGQAAYEQTLGVVPRIVGASLAGYLAGQLLNAWFMGVIKKATRGKALWVRLLGSTAVGEAADTVVFCTIAFYGVITGGQFWGYLALGYVYKCLVEVLLLPITYRVVAWVRRRENLG